MMRLELVAGAAALAYLILIAPAGACGPEDCGPPKEPPPVVTPEVPERPVLTPGGSDSEPTASYVRQYWSVCTCDEYKAAWGFENKLRREWMALEQCAARLEERNQCDQINWK